MKQTLNNLLGFTYIILSMAILMAALFYPFALAFKDAPPLWTCFILYPLAIIIMATQKNVLACLDKTVNF
jgi:hypothetical protein